MPNKNLADIAFSENGPIDIAQLHTLYHITGWDSPQRRTEKKTAQMLALDHYHIAAHTQAGQLVGFARVCGDPYIAQVLDVITHPDFRRRGIATHCMAGVLAYLNRSDYLSVTLTAGSGLADFYRPFGFRSVGGDTPALVWRRDRATFQPSVEAQSVAPYPAKQHAVSGQMKTSEVVRPWSAETSEVWAASQQPKNRPKTIGILGGISHESTIHYYDLILKKYYALNKDCYYPKIVIHSLDFQTFTDLENSGDQRGYIKEIMSGINSLEAAGVDFILMAANSPHSVYHQIKRRARLPMLSIVRETVRHAQEHNLKKLLLLGIKYTMQADFYQTASRKARIEVITPAEEEQDIINRIIFAELTLGIFRPQSKQTLLDIIGRYEVEGVILGCTELPLIIKPDDLAVPVIDTVDVHAEAALRHSLGK